MRSNRGARWRYRLSGQEENVSQAGYGACTAIRQFPFYRQLIW
ncbi:hypothetical protein CKO_02826 [Citrobacter koseri ATCC BAA-895]|uniref:Uncharacterized protein n=1 Tax=Citrobacter koseri (strain ATCC BAA-895 / CDC 4225-83 / SGSC4696) TaxID=290338 RepID=A8AKB9_CITK8|nr:hypothetical protein CKO_02826 [Citrobacter koseri ATCC BAA-895]